jgi:hypothetical protein
VFPTVIGLVLSLAPAHAFFDDFEGDRLEDYWDFWTEQNGFMDYHVHDSLLHVTGMGPYENYGNSVFIDAPVGGLYDFDLVARVGWEAGEYQSLSVGIANSIDYPGHYDIAQISYYKRPGLDPLIVAQAYGSGYNSIDAPLSGFHEFRLVRTGTTLSAYFDGMHFLTTRALDWRAYWVLLGFQGPADSQFADLYVDSISATEIPEPTALCLVGLVVLVFPRHKRLQSTIPDGGLEEIERR